MSGRRVAGPRGRRSLDELVRLACSTDPLQPVRRPRRAAIAPRAAMAAGGVLIAVAVILAIRSVLAGPAPSDATPTPGPSTLAIVDLAVADPAAPATAGPVEAGGEVVVHVAGAVASPAVVTLPAGSRVADALEAAGGASPDADTDQLNLARVLTDGEQVRVPRIGEDAAAWAGAPETTHEAAAGATGGGRVNVNTASAADLETLPGIGPALAQRIIEHRESHGPFASVDDLTDVPGIGQAKLQAMREQVTV